jgi:hypothetical protein
VIVDSFGSPTIGADLQTFDQAYGLPAPPSFRIIQPAGPVPPYDPTDANMDAGWGVETSLDVEYSHAMAPGANILLVETPVAETEGTVGFPQIIKAENFVINHGLGDVITQSFGATEQTFPSAQSIFALRGAYLNAAAHDVTVLGSSGDDGATDATSDGTDLYPFRELVAVERPARHLGWRDPVAPGRERFPHGTRQRLERHGPAQFARVGGRWPLHGIQPTLLPERSRRNRRALPRYAGREHERGGRRWRQRVLELPRH